MTTTESDSDSGKKPAAKVSSQGESVVKADVGKVKKPKTRRKPKNMPRRPLSAYNFFFREQRALILADKEQSQREKGITATKEKEPNLFSTMGKEIARRWQQLGQSGREKYTKQAEGDMQRYRNEMEEYHAEIARKTRLEAEELERRYHTAKRSSTDELAQASVSAGYHVPSSNDALPDSIRLQSMPGISSSVSGQGFATGFSGSSITDPMLHAQLLAAQAHLNSSLLSSAGSGGGGGDNLFAAPSVTETQLLQVMIAQQQLQQLQQQSSLKSLLNLSAAGSGSDLLQRLVLEQQQRSSSMMYPQRDWGQTESHNPIFKGLLAGMARPSSWSDRANIAHGGVVNMPPPQAGASTGHSADDPNILLQFRLREEQQRQQLNQRMLQQLSGMSPADLQALAGLMSGGAVAQGQQAPRDWEAGGSDE